MIFTRENNPLQFTRHTVALQTVCLHAEPMMATYVIVAKARLIEEAAP